jgi:hypothetical protein
VLALAAGFGASDFIASDALDFGASDFIVSEEEAGGVAAAGGLPEPGLEPGDGDCAMADDNINPLSAVVSNSFFNIGKPPCKWCLVVNGVGHGFSFAAWKIPALFSATFECMPVFRAKPRAMTQTDFNLRLPQPFLKINRG